jgi:hypothetical protein
VFKDLDEIRRKQIEIASDHIALETLGDITQVKTTELGIIWWTGNGTG